VRVYSFPPVFRSDARILILGSMPGVASLTAAQYYAHPRNRFWDIMDRVCSAGRDIAYEQRLQRLLDHQLALWDVLHSCVRPGSLDAAIEHHTAMPNDLTGLLSQLPSLQCICCNGGTAFLAMKRYFAAQLSRAYPRIEQLKLPSTSPANASWSHARKLRAWRRALRAVSRA
jgi:TDG/mug DNA glycosylase family protein